MSSPCAEPREEERRGLQVTNQGGWHSPTDLLADPLLQPIFHWIAGCTTQALQGLDWYLARAVTYFNNAWAMVNRRGDSVRAHLHPNSLFNRVFYITAPEGSGTIAFLDPHSGSQMLLPPLAEPDSDFARGRVRFAPARGRLLLFPAWAWHEVEQSAGDKLRICVSFNIGMKPV